MDIDKYGLSKSKLKIILSIWAMVTVLASFFIPQYDFGFDGVKVWLILSSIILLTLFVAAGFLSRLRT